jgi:hypothetical protein
VIVTAIWDPTTFTVQFVDRMAEIDRALGGTLQKRRSLPSMHELVALRVGARTFRARIERVRADTGRATVALIDFGDAGSVPLAWTFDLPPEIAHIEPQRKTVQLACLGLARPAQETVDAVWERVRDRHFFLQFAYEDDDVPPAVFLTDKPIGQATSSLNADLVRKRIASWHYRETPAWLAQTAADLQAAANGLS